MTIGILVPLIVALGDWMMALQFLRRLRALPTSTDIGYDEAAVAREARGIRIVLTALVLTPVLVYLAFNHLVPEIGAMELL